MTEKEFLQQVWRPYDTVTVDGNIKGRVQNVCFATRSVRIKMPVGAPEWFRCELIIAHKSATGETDDIGIIENLHNKLMEAEKRIEKLTDENAQQAVKINAISAGTLIKNINMISTLVREKKSRINKIETCMEEISTAIARINALVDLDEPIEL